MSESTDTLDSIIAAVKKGSVKVPALKLVKENPEVAAVISKLVRPRDKTGFDVERKESYYNLNQSKIQAISDNTKARINDNKNIFQLFPDIELAVQILVSSILSPKDMVKTELIYRSDDPIFTAELNMKLVSIVENHVNGHYKLKENLHDMLRETLFNTGSYVNVTIPESIVDEIINENEFVSTEALKELFVFNETRPNELTSQSLGILGNPGKPRDTLALENFFNTTKTTKYQGNLSLESLDLPADKTVETFLEITDNYMLLKLPKVVEASNRSKLRQITRRNTALESFKSKSKMTNAEMSATLYKDNAQKMQPFAVIPGRNNAKRKSIGRPMVMRLPSESVIPVYIPGDETKHIGYFVLIDIDGNPVTINSNHENMEGLSGIMNNGGGNQSLSSLLLQKARRNLVSNEDKNNAVTLDDIMKVYSSIVEKDLIERLRNGIYGNNVAISNNSEIYRIMLARNFASKYTRLVYIPEELVTYFAFRYFDNGVGKSYLDDLKVLTSLRAILLFSKVMASTKNSIALTNVNMTLDPNDPDPQKSIELATHEIIKMRQQYFPLGANSPMDLVDWIQRAGLEFTFEGHPALPQTKFDFSTQQMQHTLPDSDLDELLRKQTYMAFGLSPETVDNGFNAEFATTVISNNILLSKRVLQHQQTFTADLTDMVKKITINDRIIIDELLAAVQENKGLFEKSIPDDEKAFYSENEERYIGDTLERFIGTLVVDLPKPDITTLATQTEAFEQYSNALDKAIDAWISSDFITTDLAGETSTTIDVIKQVVKSYFLRNWMSENGYMSELNDIVTADEDGNATLDIYDINKTHVEGIVRSSIRLIKAMQPVKNAADKDLESMNVELEGESLSSSSDDTSGSEFGGDDFGFGGDDFGGGEMDFGGDMTGETPAEETPEETPPTEEEPKEETPEDKDVEL